MLYVDFIFLGYLLWRQESCQ